MDSNKQMILADIADTRSMKAIFSSVKKIFCYHYDKKSFKEIAKCFKQVKNLFEGNYPGYSKCNTKYHNLHHTMNVFLAVARLMDGYNLKQDKMSERLTLNLLKAGLLHDTGYIQEKWDNEGTGAKHTTNHVGRSIAFIVKNRGDFSTSKEDVDSITKLIRCSEIKCKLNTIPFASEEEKNACMILGSADILGQMSDREYLERLLFLYNEMKEAGVPGYTTEFDIIKSTLELYNTVKKKLNNTFKEVYIYAEVHFNERNRINKNLYIEAIENNIQYIEKIINDRTTNFRYKLKRGNFKELSAETLASAVV
jgi:hypothetical protein